MSEEMKLIIALQQIHNIVNLTKENQYKQFLYSHLSSIQYELERQLTNLSITDKIKETTKEE